jgi:hypothetical protein
MLVFIVASVHGFRFLAALKRIAETPTKGVYQITCPLPRLAVTWFKLDDMKAFSVSDHLYMRGYAEPGEYRAAPRRMAS